MHTVCFRLPLMLLTPPCPRNTISDLSITLLCPKTSSVPLDGKIFKAATLDAELATELEGATLFEEAGSKDNYVVYWYHCSRILRTSVESRLNF